MGRRIDPTLTALLKDCPSSYRMYLWLGLAFLLSRSMPGPFLHAITFFIYSINTFTAGLEIQGVKKEERGVHQARLPFVPYS